MYYDLLEDYELIEASFAQQYGIRLRREEAMSWGEFASLLAGLNETTPLGRVVAIRGEQDPQVVKGFTPEQKRLRRQWRDRRVPQKPGPAYTAAMEGFESLFRALSQ